MRRQEPIQAFNLRMPKAVHKLLMDAAAEDRRSANDEIVVALEEWLRARSARRVRARKRG